MLKGGDPLRNTLLWDVSGIQRILKEFSQDVSQYPRVSEDLTETRDTPAELCRGWPSELYTRKVVLHADGFYLGGLPSARAIIMT